MAGNRQGSVTIKVESTSDIVLRKGLLSRVMRSTPCYISFKYNKHEVRVDETLTSNTSSHHEWNKEVCFQIDPTHGDCVWVNMYRDNDRLIGECNIILSEVPNVNHRPFRRTFDLMKGSSNEGGIQGHLKLSVTFNRPAQEAPYPPPPPPPPPYPPQWPHPQPPQQPMYPPGPTQPWQNGQQQAHSPFYPPGPTQGQWQNGPPASQPMPHHHPGPLYPLNHLHMNHNQGNHQAQHPGAMPDLNDIPIAEIYPPPISFAPGAPLQSYQHHQEQQANQPPLASLSTDPGVVQSTDDDEDSDMENFFEAFAPSLNR